MTFSKMSLCFFAFFLCIFRFVFSFFFLLFFLLYSFVFFFFFFQAEDGIRDVAVTGVQTCALPIFVVLVIRDEGDAMAESRRIADQLIERGLRVRLDDRVDTGFGRRAVDWEIKGVPVRVEVGPRDLATGEVTVTRRDLNEKATVPLDVVA